MKTYFNYKDALTSKGISEAISMVYGSGPILGFGSASIDEEKSLLTVKPLPYENDPLYNQMVGRRYRWKIFKGTNSSEEDQTNFVGITQDGYIFGSSEGSIEVPLQGSKGNFDEVILLAYHQPINYPVENPVTFIAYWSSSSDSFYNLYKTSINPLYPKGDYTPNTTLGGLSDFNQLNYGYLVQAVNKACDYYLKSSRYLSIIGIYGTGINQMTHSIEPFALVPYEGCFPNKMDFTVGMYNILKHK